MIRVLAAISIVAACATIAGYGVLSWDAGGTVEYADVVPGAEAVDDGEVWGTVEHYAQRAAELYAKRTHGEHPEEFPAIRTDALADGIVELYWEVQRDDDLRLRLPERLRVSMDAANPDELASGLIDLHNAVQSDDELHRMLPEEFRVPLKAVRYYFATEAPFCLGDPFCADVDYMAGYHGADDESYLRSSTESMEPWNEDNGVRKMCEAARDDLTGQLPWLEGDAEWLFFMDICRDWHSRHVSYSIVAYLTENVSERCRNLIDSGWVVGNSGDFYRPGATPHETRQEFYPDEVLDPEHDYGNTLFKSRCLPSGFPPSELLLRHPPEVEPVGWASDPADVVPGAESEGDDGEVWGTVEHYAQRAAELYAKRTHGEHPEKFPAISPDALADGIVELYWEVQRDDDLRLRLPERLRVSMDAANPDELASGLLDLHNAVQSDDELHRMLPEEFRVPLKAVVYHFDAPTVSCSFWYVCQDEFVSVYSGSDDESYLRSVQHTTKLWQDNKQKVCRAANDKLVGQLPWLEGNAEWLVFMGGCEHWHSKHISESIVAYLTENVSERCRDLIDSGWVVGNSGSFYRPVMPHYERWQEFLTNIFTLGSTTVTCTETDESGKTGRAAFRVTVSSTDVVPPVITLSADMSIPATSSVGATETFTVTARGVDGAV